MKIETETLTSEPKPAVSFSTKWVTEDGYKISWSPSSASAHCFADGWLQSRDEPTSADWRKWATMMNAIADEVEGKR